MSYSTYSNKTYVAFDADNDIHYYRLMQAWKKNDNTSFNFYDAHDLNNIYVYSEENIKRNLLERMKNTKVFILLVGENTKYLYKFVRWEIEQALKRGLPIIVVNLDGKRSKDSTLCPPILDEELALHISFNQKIIEKAIVEWPSLHKGYKSKSEIDAYYYLSKVYKELNI